MDILLRHTTACFFYRDIAGIWVLMVDSYHLVVDYIIDDFMRETSQLKRQNFSENRK